MNRRQFLAGSSLFALGLGATKFVSGLGSQKPETSRFLAACYSNQAELTQTPEVYEKRFTPRVPGDFRLFDLSTRRLQNLSLPFFPHSVVQSRSQPETLAVFERWNTQAALLSLSPTPKLRHLIEAPTGFYFYGHGDFTQDGKTLVITGVAVEDKTGYIFFYDVETGQAIGQMLSGGKSPHDCFVEGSRLFVANSGSKEAPSKLSILNLKSRDIEREIEKRSHFFTHLTKPNPETIIGGSGFDGSKFPTLTQVHLGFLGESITQMDLSILQGTSPGEALSLAGLTPDRFLATLSHSKNILECRLQENSVRLHSTPDAFGVLAVTEDHSIFACGKLTGHLYRLWFTVGGELHSELIHPDFGNSIHGRMLKFPTS